MIRPVLRSIAMAIFLIPGAAMAHTGIGQTAGFAHGLAHPASGIDHTLAMVAVGVFAWQLGGRALWLVPATFVLVMIAGGTLGMAGIDIPFVETGIALSVVILGAIIALGMRAPVATAMAIVGAFAVFHGHAHGAEMPHDASGLTYGAGFMLGTALLHASGLALGFFIGRIGEARSPDIVRAAGMLTSVAGIAILAGIL